MTQSGGLSSKWRFTGPSTPSTSYCVQVLKAFSSQPCCGNSSSSMQAMKSPAALATALLRASAIFCRDSTQYLICMDEEDANCVTTSRADSDSSLSTITIEYVNRP